MTYNIVKRNTFSILFFIRREKKNKYEESPIYCRITIQEKKREFSTQLRTTSTLAKAENLVKLISWMIHDGQKFSGALNYAPLSPAAVSVGDAILKTVTFEGKPVLK